MKQKWLIALLGLVVLFSARCDKTKSQADATSGSGNSESANGKTSKVQWIDPNIIHEGPVQHETLSATQIARITDIHRTFAEVDDSSLEKTIDGFKRDRDPDRELTIWEAMGKAYRRYVDSRSLSIDAKKEVFKVVLLRSMASEEDVLANLDLKILTKDDVRVIMAGY